MQMGPHAALQAKRRARYPLDADAAAAIHALSCAVRDGEENVVLQRDDDRRSACALLLAGFAFRYKLGLQDRARSSGSSRLATSSASNGSGSHRSITASRA